MARLLFGFGSGSGSGKRMCCLVLFAKFCKFRFEVSHLCRHGFPFFGLLGKFVFECFPLFARHRLIFIGGEKGLVKGTLLEFFTIAIINELDKLKKISQGEDGFFIGDLLICVCREITQFDDEAETFQNFVIDGIRKGRIIHEGREIILVSNCHGSLPWCRSTASGAS